VLTTNPNAVYATIRPTAGGDSTQWAKSGSGGSNYDRVDEATWDGDTTYVYATSGNPLDLYQLGDITLTSGYVIESVAVTAVAKYVIPPQCSDGIDNDFDGLIDYPKDPGCTSPSDNSEIDPMAAPSPKASGSFHLAVKTGGQTYTSSAQNADSSYQARTWTMTTNPATGTAWTEADVDALQAGVKLGSTTSEVRVTQVYVTVKTTSSMRLTLDYGYNGAGDLTSLGITPPTGSAFTETFAFDGQDRLRRWTASGGATFSQAFGYNAAGDRTSLAEDGATWSYTVDEDHRLKQYNKTGLSATMAYDAMGNARWRNVTQGTTTRYEYVYDAEDRLTTVKRGGTTIATYAYDGLGRRVKAVEDSTTSYFVYSGLSLIYSVTGTSTTRYVYASGLLVAQVTDGATSYVHQVVLGSVRALSDGNGHWTYFTQYKPFGQEYGTQGTGPKLKYTGQQKDAATGLYYLFRRFYDPEIGRFLSQDPILGHLTVPQSLARYTYAVNNPLRYVDPAGEDWWNPLTWGSDLGSAVSSAAAAVGNWWASSSIWDKIDMAMTVIGFVPGLDVVSGRGSWQDVGMNARSSSPLG